MRGCDFILDDSTKSKINSVIWWLTESKKPGLLLYGNYGSGKTTMCNAIKTLFEAIISLNEQNKRNRGMLSDADNRKIDYISQWIDIPTIITASEIINLATTNQEEYAKLNNKRYLIIDEFGRETVEANNYGTKSEPIIELLGIRYEKMMATIMTSNLDDAGIEAKYTRYVSDRFNEMFDKISYENKSYRK